MKHFWAFVCVVIATSEQQCLIQGQGRQALAGDPANTLQKHDGTKQTSSALETMALTSIRGGLAIDPSTKTSLSNIVETLERTHEAVIKQAHADDQTNLNSASAHLTTASSDFASDQTSDKLIYSEQIARKRSSHQICRSDGQSLDETKKETCDDLTKFIEQVKGNEENCEIPERKGIAHYFQQLEEHIRLYRADWKQNEEACSNKESVANTKSIECGTAKAAFEQSICAYRNRIHSTCVAYGQKYDSFKEAFDEQKVEVSRRESDRQIEWTAVYKIKCFIGVIQSNASESERATHLDTCKILVVDTDHLNIIVPSLPSKDDCSFAEVKILPCSDEFEGQQYAHLWFLDNKIPACQPCDDLPHTP